MATGREPTDRFYLCVDPLIDGTKQLSLRIWLTNDGRMTSLSTRRLIRRSDNEKNVIAFEEVSELINHCLHEVFQMRSHLFEHYHIVEFKWKKCRPPTDR